MPALWPWYKVQPNAPGWLHLVAEPVDRSSTRLVQLPGQVPDPDEVHPHVVDGPHIGVVHVLGHQPVLALGVLMPKRLQVTRVEPARRPLALDGDGMTAAAAPVSLDQLAIGRPQYAGPLRQFYRQVAEPVQWYREALRVLPLADSDLPERSPVALEDHRVSPRC